MTPDLTKSDILDLAYFDQHNAIKTLYFAHCHIRVAVTSLTPCLAHKMRPEVKTSDRLVILNWKILTTAASVVVSEEQKTETALTPDKTDTLDFYQNCFVMM